MPRNRIMDYMMMRDGRNPYGSRGGYVVSSRRMRRRDRGMDYGYDRRDYRGGDVEYGSRDGNYPYMQQDNARGRRDYEPMGQYDMARRDYGDMRDMHYGERQGNFQPVEAMGYFTGYYGGGDMARGGRRDYGDYNYDMRGGRDYGYDFGEMLEKEDAEEWAEKLKKEVDEKDKQFFSKEHLKKKAEEMGIKFDKFSFEDFMVTSLMVYTDFCKTLGSANMDLYLRLAKDWLMDEDVAVKYGRKLAAYYDYIVDPE